MIVKDGVKKGKRERSRRLVALVCDIVPFSFGVKTLKLWGCELKQIYMALLTDGLGSAQLSQNGLRSVLAILVDLRALAALFRKISKLHSRQPQNLDVFMM